MASPSSVVPWIVNTCEKNPDRKKIHKTPDSTDEPFPQSNHDKNTKSK